MKSIQMYLISLNKLNINKTVDIQKQILICIQKTFYNKKEFMQTTYKYRERLKIKR